MKILIIDDDPVIHESLSIYLKAENFSVISAFDGEEGIQKFLEEQPSLIILDMMMPKMNGTEVCREIRTKSHVPIIMLTAKSEEIDKILSLELGADDYVTKPFSTRELIARIKSVLRRTQEITSTKREENSHVSPDFELDNENYQVKLFGKPVQLTPKEFDILYVCVKNINKIVSRELIMREVWGESHTKDSRMIDSHIKKIREKIIIPGATWSLSSIYRIGYKFELLPPS